MYVKENADSFNVEVENDAKKLRKGENKNKNDQTNFSKT